MVYTKNDLANIIALCEQDESGNPIAARLLKRCQRAYAYRDVDIHLTRNDKTYLRQVYDDEMDADALATLQKIL